MVGRGAVSLDGAIWLAARQFEAVERLLAASLGDADDPLGVGDLVLPPVGGAIDDASALRLVTPCYLACELHRAGLLDALDTLSGLYVAGGISADLGATGEGLIAVWRSRNQTISTEERSALCRRVFEPAAGDSVDAGLAELAEHIVADDDARRRRLPPRLGVRVTAAARALAASAAQRAQGLPPLAVRELIAGVRRALAVLAAEEIRTWLGVRSTWAALDVVNQRFAGRPSSTRSVSLRVDRAKSGAVLLAWVADVVSDGRRIDRIPTAVADAAHEWVEATLGVLDEAA